MYKQIAFLGVQGKAEMKNKCKECKKEDDGKSIQCKHCKQIYHNTCLTKVMDKNDIDKTIALKDTFNCLDCLIDPTRDINPQSVAVNELQTLVVRVNDIMEQEKIEEINKDDFSCNKCKFSTETHDELSDHIKTTHKIIFQQESEPKVTEIIVNNINLSLIHI